ncbi:MAG: transposase [Candidatus Faecalibacterium intestinavium]|uniref:Transposase n=1 Tax=Candidatus Faecalibacterium intestinavium TaxID=2838580 RepID=A0A9E2KK03_9FIRM|nr:transposase [Candidatus Faecalibacterium intestinavium]
MNKKRRGWPIMAQMTFSDLEYSRRKKKTRREIFLEKMNELVPWAEWVAAVEPFYPRGRRGRPPVGVEKMLRMYLLQNWFGFSAAALEEAVYDSYALRRFMGVDFLESGVPDATTLLKFRQLLERKGLHLEFEAELRRRLAEAGQMLKPGVAMDPLLIRGTGALAGSEPDGAAEDELLPLEKLAAGVPPEKR